MTAACFANSEAHLVHEGLLLARMIHAFAFSASLIAGSGSGDIC
jgi:hypothetical protein